jgi:ribonuclease J
MALNIAQHKNDLLFLPLGGAGEIGMNLNLYHLDGKWLMVDLGAGFADDYLPGIDMIVPDITFIHRHRENLLGLVLTHAHEDHLGAVQYIWDELRCPIYATPFTAKFLKEKLKESGLNKIVPIHEVACGSTINLDPFNIELVPLAHSAPEMQALAIKTKHGTVFHTGDWKFDPDPLVGNPADLDLLKSYGDKGILALVGDSTNVFNSGTSGSEGDLRKSLKSLIADCDQLVAVATFASNLARIETILHAADDCGRKVVLLGKSLWRIVKAAEEAGYLKDRSPFVEAASIGKYKRSELLVLCTGCQGEPMAAMTKLAGESHPNLKLKANDTVIFSSKIIPGNDKKIFRVFNQLVKLNVEVLTEKDHFVHVSGHPAKDELKMMYELIRPEIAVPVHGEMVHLHEHVKLAKSWGVPKAVQIENGDLVRLAPNEPEKIGTVEAGYLGVDGNYLVSPKSPVMSARRKMRIAGLAIAVISINKDGKLVNLPSVKAPGLFDFDEDGEVLNYIAEELEAAIESHLMSKSSKYRNSDIEQIARSTIRRCINQEINKQPVIEIIINKI